MMDFKEFIRPPWRLRAIWCENVTIENDPAFENMTACYMWFVGQPILCEWFALGLSDYANDDYADRVRESIDDDELAALLPYGGDTWSNVTTMSAVAFGSQQRALYAALRGDPLARLTAMSRDAILTLREQETPADKAWLN